MQRAAVARRLKKKSNSAPRVLSIFCGAALRAGIRCPEPWVLWGPAAAGCPLLWQPRLERLANIMKTKGNRPAGDGKRAITHSLVGIIMGSGSDWDTMKYASKTLGELGVPHETRVVSAHRTPDLLFEYAAAAEKRGIEVIIAG